jgi:rubrerythrin
VKETIMPEPTRDMRFMATLPALEKSVQYQPDGSFYVGGIASDPSLDLQRDRVDQAAVLSHGPYLEQWGKLDWNHGREDIGDIVEVRKITAAEAADEFGVKLAGDGTYVKARVYPVGDVALAPEDLKTAHHRAGIDARLGFSLEGSTRRQGGTCYPTAIYRVALCPQPVNTNTVAVPMAKSMAEAQELWEAGQPDVVIEYPEPEALEKGRQVSAHTRQLASGKIAPVVAHTDKREAAKRPVRTTPTLLEDDLDRAASMAADLKKLPSPPKQKKDMLLGDVTGYGANGGVSCAAFTIEGKMLAGKPDRHFVANFTYGVGKLFNRGASQLIEMKPGESESTLWGDIKCVASRKEAEQQAELLTKYQAVRHLDASRGWGDLSSPTGQTKEEMELEGAEMLLSGMKKSLFADPFPGLRAGEPFTPPDLMRAIRQCIASEQEAVALYEAIADAAAGAEIDSLTVEVLRSVADEERVHAGEFLRLLDTLNGSEGRKLAEGADEVETIIEGTDVTKARVPFVKGLLALAKAHVKAHTRTVGGKVVSVKEHDDKRGAAKQGGGMSVAHASTWARDPAMDKLLYAMGHDNTQYKEKASGPYRWVREIETSGATLSLTLQETDDRGRFTASGRITESASAKPVHHDFAVTRRCTSPSAAQTAIEKEAWSFLGRSPEDLWITKSLATSAATDESALEGGATLRRQSLKPRSWHCDKCGADVPGEEPLCKCGAKRPGQMAKALVVLAKAHVKGHTRVVGGKVVQVKEHEDKREAAQSGAKSAAVIRQYADKVRADAQGPSRGDYQGAAGVARLNKTTALLDLYAELLDAEGPEALSRRAERLRAAGEHHTSSADLKKLTDELRLLTTCSGLLAAAKGGAN